VRPCHLAIIAFVGSVSCQRPPVAPAAHFPIIDVHVHADPLWQNADTSWYPAQFRRPASDQALIDETLRIMKELNVVRAVVGSYEWNIGPLRRYLAASGNAVLGSVGLAGSPQFPDSIRRWHADGTIQAFGEVTSQYAGLAPADPKQDGLWSLAEELDVPVGYHIGLGPPGIAGSSAYRMNLSNALLLEDVLVRHPKLRIYVMHAGWPRLDEMVALLYEFPEVYVDLGVINWYIPREEFHAYLRRLVAAGFGRRIMFGSDQMQWPESIRAAVEAVDSATFLRPDQKEDIFCRNAARFFRLDAAVCTPGV